MIEQNEIELVKEDFLKSGWQDVIFEASPRVCSFFSSRFSAKANESTDINIKEILKLLSSITSMYSKLDTPNDPYGPMMTFGDSRTAIVEDFTEKQLTFFEEILNDITNSELRARIADVLWIRKGDRKIAELAITSYIESARELEHPEHWTHTVDRIERALQIAVRFGRVTEFYTSIISFIEELLDKYNGEDPLFLSANLMRLLQEKREIENAEKYINLCEKMARNAESQNDHHKARNYWQLKTKWHFMQKDEESARQTKLDEANTYEKEAEMYLKGEPVSYQMVSHFTQQAVEAYRRAGKSEEKVAELKRKLIEYQTKAVTELKSISSEGIDISSFVEKSVKNVSGKSFFESLSILVLSFNPPEVNNLRTQVESHRTEFAFQSLIHTLLLDSKGKVIAEKESEGDEAIRADMFQYANRSRGIYVQAIIEPSRIQILSEHRARTKDFLDFLENHSFIPQGRELIIARGLQAGLYGDFLTAVHFLIPQLEESIRHILIQLGNVPSSLNTKGIQSEYSLNETLKKEEFTSQLNRLFGEDLIFDLRGLLTEKFGANLRNDMAHGLIEFGSFYSEFGCYLWWIALRFYLIPYFMREAEVTETDSPVSAE